MIEFKATDKWYKDAAESETDYDISAGLDNFAKKFIALQEDIDPEFEKFYQENKWNLYA